MRWYSPDLTNESISNACLTKLENILHSESSEDVNMSTKYSQLHKEQKFEKLLIDIRSADYHTIEQCLYLIAENNDETVQLIWKLSKQYSETNFDKYICGYCKIRKHIGTLDCSRYLCRHGIISDQLLESIIDCSSDQASHDDLLWNHLENELKQHDTSKQIKEALTSTLKTYSKKYADVSTEIREWLCDPKTKFKCSCQELRLPLLKPANNCETDTDTSAVDFEEAEITGKRKSRCNSKSTRGTRRVSFRSRGSKYRQNRSQSATNAINQREVVPKRPWSFESISSSQHDIDYVNVPSFQRETDTKCVDHKKTTKIFNFNNIHGPISFGNRFMRVGNQEVSDTSNDTDGYMSNSSNMDLRKSFKSDNLKPTSHEGITSADVSSCSSNIFIPPKTIESVSNETATSTSVLKTDGAEMFSGRDENHASVTLQKSSTEANALETTDIKRNTTSMKVNNTVKHSADFTETFNHETADNDDETQKSTVESQADLAHTTFEEDTASSKGPFELGESDADTQVFFNVRRTQVVNDKSFERTGAKSEDKHIELITSSSTDKATDKAYTNKENIKHYSPTDDKNVKKDADVTDQIQTDIIASPSIDKNRDSTDKSRKKEEKHSKPTTENMNVTEEKNDKTEEKQFEHKQNAVENTDGKNKHIQIPNDVVTTLLNRAVIRQKKKSTLKQEQTKSGRKTQK